MSIYQYEVDRWREHQSKVTSFLSLLDKQRNTIQNSNLYVCKLLELNELFNQVENVVDEIKYECIYPNSKYKNNEKIKEEIRAHLETKSKIKKMAIMNHNAL